MLLPLADLFPAGLIPALRRQALRLDELAHRRSWFTSKFYAKFAFTERYTLAMRSYQWINKKVISSQLIERPLFYSGWLIYPPYSTSLWIIPRCHITCCVYIAFSLLFCVVQVWTEHLPNFLILVFLIEKGNSISIFIMSRYFIKQKTITKTHECTLSFFRLTGSIFQMVPTVTHYRWNPVVSANYG